MPILAYRLYVELGSTNLHVAAWDGGWGGAVCLEARGFRGNPSWKAVVSGLLMQLGVEDDQCIGGVVCAPQPSHQHILNGVRDLTGTNLRLFGKDVRVDMPVAYDDPTAFGEDRLLGAFAASELVCKPCIVLDAGTCVTCDAVSAEGGILPIAIAPGLATLREGMQDAAYHLREAIASWDAATLAAAPRGAHSTEECIRFGLRSQLAGMCSECVAAARQVLGLGDLAQVPIITTGGDGGLLCELLPGARHEPMLCLDGLRLLDQRASR